MNQGERVQRFRRCCVVCDSMQVLRATPDLLASVAYAWGVENERNAQTHAERLCDDHRRSVESSVLAAEVLYVVDGRGCDVCGAAASAHVAPPAYATGLLAERLARDPFRALCAKHAIRMGSLLRSLHRSRAYEARAEVPA